MNVKDLKTFQVVACEGNFSRAAKKLHFVQSNVTNRIKQLEKHFETELFYRHRHGVTLTPNGKILLRYAEKVLQLVAESEHIIRHAHTLAGPLSIGSMETTAAIRLPDLLVSFTQLYPQVELVLQTGPTEQLIQAVVNYELEGAFVAGPVQHPELQTTTFMEEKLIILSRQAISSWNELAVPSSLSLLVFRRGCSYRKRLEEWLSTEGILPVKVMEFGSLEAILGCVKAGLGVTLIPESVAERLDPEQDLHRHNIPGQFGKVKTLFVYRHTLVQSAPFQRFLELVQNCENRSAN